MNRAPVYRLAERTGCCRVCDKDVERLKDKAVYFYSWRNRGQNIIICPKCIKDMYQLVMENESGD